MKTIYRYIKFEYEPALEQWVCYNKESEGILAKISFYSVWKQFIAEFNSCCVFNNQCLRDIADFLDQLNKKYPGKNKPTGHNAN